MRSRIVEGISGRNPLYIVSLPKELGIRFGNYSRNSFYGFAQNSISDSFLNSRNSGISPWIYSAISSSSFAVCHRILSAIFPCFFQFWFFLEVCGFFPGFLQEFFFPRFYSEIHHWVPSEIFPIVLPGFVSELLSVFLRKFMQGYLPGFFTEIFQCFSLKSFRISSNIFQRSLQIFILVVFWEGFCIVSTGIFARFLLDC